MPSGIIAIEGNITKHVLKHFTDIKHQLNGHREIKGKRIIIIEAEFNWMSNDRIGNEGEMWNKLKFLLELIDQNENLFIYTINLFKALRKETTTDITKIDKRIVISECVHNTDSLNPAFIKFPKRVVFQTGKLDYRYIQRNAKRLMEEYNR